MSFFGELVGLLNGLRYYTFAGVFWFVKLGGLYVAFFARSTVESYVAFSTFVTFLTLLWAFEVNKWVTYTLEKF